jgi:hypothetical protein
MAGFAIKDTVDSRWNGDKNTEFPAPKFLKTAF